MPLTKDQKAAAVEALTRKLEDTPTIYLTDYAGLTVEQANTLRNAFREAGVEFKVVKNTLLKRAMDAIGGYDELYEQLNGPTAVAFSEEPSAPARVIKKFLNDARVEKPQLKGAHVEGAVYDADALDTLTKLKSKAEILAEVIGLLLSPMSNVIGALESQGSKLVGAIGTIAEREEA